MAQRRKRTSLHSPAKTAADVADVLGARLPMLWAMSFNPTPERQAEANRMVSEKMVAASRGIFEASMAWTAEYQRLWLKGLTTPLTMGDMTDAMTHITNQGTAPARTKLAANARRLRKRKSI